MGKRNRKTIQLEFVEITNPIINSFYKISIESISNINVFFNLIVPYFLNIALGLEFAFGLEFMIIRAVFDTFDAGINLLEL